MEIVAPKPQSLPKVEQPRAHEVTFNGDLLIPKFWNEFQAVLADQIAKGKLVPLEMGVYGCSKGELAELKAALDEALSTFGTDNL